MWKGIPVSNLVEIGQKFRCYCEKGEIVENRKSLDTHEEQQQHVTMMLTFSVYWGMTSPDLV